MSSQAVLYHGLKPAFSPPTFQKKRDFSAIVQKIARESLIELSVSSAIALSIPFTANLAFSGSVLIGAVLIQSAATTALRFFREYYLSKANGETPLSEALSWTHAGLFYLFSAYNGLTLIHEAGHSLASRILFKNAHPHIWFIGYGTAFTDYAVSEMTFFGKWMGKSASSAIVAFAGPFLSLSVSSALLIFALKIKKSFPTLYKMLTVAALSDFLFHAIYAWSALFSPKNLMLDFSRLALAGLHPLAAAVAILAIPILIWKSVSEKGS